MIRCLLPVAAAAFVGASPLYARDMIVHTTGELDAAVQVAIPGDQIVLANGQWRDVDIRFDARGTAARPITLRAMTPGKVVISGTSTLRMAGQHLIVSDLVFRAGQPRDEAAIVTHIGERWTEDSRLTGIVIAGFNTADRRKEDHWVALYGRSIRVDHSDFRGKQNAGAMLIVVRMPGWPLDNRIRIDHNYFGPRPVLGSNGGETIRVGTSDESLTASGSVIEDNIFERCDGEVEIISIKSGGNTIRRNLFLRSQGAVVLRHGNGNVVESNIFLGMSAANTGGVRVINRDQIVRNNYFEGLGGLNFVAALSLMNGVPNSAINRYHQVVGAQISHNTIINSAEIRFGAGASAERSLAPDKSQVSGNLVVAEKSVMPLRVEASTSGITFMGNISNAIVPAGGGFEQQPVPLRRASNGLLYPADSALGKVGVSRQLIQPRRSQTGPTWYRVTAQEKSAAAVGKVIKVSSSVALQAAVAKANNGDFIELGAGQFEMAEPLVVRHRVTLSGARAKLSFRSAALFVIEEGGGLTLRGLDISGKRTPVADGNAVIRSAQHTMLANYAVDIEDCNFTELAASPRFDLIATSPSTLAASIRIARSDVSDLSGTLVAAAAERGTDGLYPVEQIELEQLRLVRVGTIADVLRQGTDESTFGPRFVMKNSTVSDSGAVRLAGVQDAMVTQNTFTRSGGVTVVHSVGEPHTRITGNAFLATPMPIVTELAYAGPARAEIRDNRTQ